MVRQVEKWPHINSSNIWPSKCTVRNRAIHTKMDLGRVSENSINNLGGRFCWGQFAMQIICHCVIENRLYPVLVYGFMELGH